MKKELFMNLLLGLWACMLMPMQTVLIFVLRFA
jgi:hypothetical protein